MEMKKSVLIKTVDVQSSFKITIGGKTSLFDAAMRKVAILQNMAKYEKNIYAFIYLIEINEKINLTLKKLDKKMKKFKASCRVQMSNIANIRFPIKETREYAFSNPVNCGLVKLLQKFDDCIALILLAKNLSVFSDQKTFFSLKNQVKKECLSVLSDVIKIKARDIEKVTITHYLKNDAIYLAVAERVGVTDPQKLYNAIFSSATPDISTAEINWISACLKDKVTHTDK